MDAATVKARVEALLSLETSNLGIAGTVARCNELLTGALTVMTAIYGAESHQVAMLNGIARQQFQVAEKATSFAASYVIPLVRGALENLKAELDAGLAGSLQKRMTGDVLTDFLQLARAILQEAGDDAKNVAAVLAAAAFEDTIRRMATALGGVVGGDDLHQVIDALKQKGVLQAPQLGIALSYLNFRNRALHAKWEQIDRASVQSVLGFVEELVLKHFQ